MKRTAYTILCLVASLALPLQAQQAVVSPTPPVNPAQSAQPLLAPVNARLPAWLRFSGEYRMRVEGLDGGAFKPETRDAYGLSRLRLNMRVVPTHWVRFQFQAQDAQVFGKNTKPDSPPFEDTMDLRAAYVEFGKAEAPAVSLRVGRQELFFGEQRLVGHLNWTNTARSFDAARLTLQRGRVKVDVFASSVVNLREGTANKSSGGNDLHGVYGAITKIIPNSTVEPYAMWRLARGTATEVGSPGLLNRRIFGVRLSGKLPANFDYSVEMTGQTGSVGSDDVEAAAGHWVLGYTLAALKMKPRLVAEYNYASGDEARGDGRQQTFDQLYPTGHDKYGLADQVGWRNIHHVRSGVEFKPAAKLTLSGSYHSWWLASTRDGLYNAAGALFVRVPSGSAGRHVGQEADLQMTYALTSQTAIAAGYANIFPGTFLKNATPGRQYRLPYMMLTWSF